MSQSDMFRSIIGDKHLRILGVPEDKKIDYVEFLQYCTELERKGAISQRRRQIYIDQAEHANKETRLYFTADTHFGQEDVIKALRRPFSSLSEMNDRLIRNWNEVVGPRDTVFHLGDFGAGSRKDLNGIFGRLNGQKILIEGDQDADSSLRLPWTDTKKAWRIIVNGQKLWLMHHPQHSWDGREQGTWHLHGHVHGEGNSPDLSLDVGVDCWGYRPVSFTKIQEKMDRLKLSPSAVASEQQIANAQPAGIEIVCPSCGATYRNVKPEQIGKVGRCRKCGHKFRVVPKTDEPGPRPDSSQEAAILSAQTQAKFGAVETVAASPVSSKDVSPLKSPAKSPARSGYAKSPGDSAVLHKAEHDVATDWNVGDVILDLYEVTDILGEGGMGKVYKVRHLGWDMDLAVKCPRKEYLAASGGTEDYIREAETWVNLGQHPNVVGCYYVRTLGEIPRLFAEYVEGGSLSDWIRNRKVYEGNADEILARILDIGIQTAWGLHHAHEKGLVHQDMKPGNVMMTSDGVAKITDFGLARKKGSAGTTVSSPAAGKTMVVAAAGMYTPEYASPEQLTGSHLTRRSDIWNWAVSMVEMFAGGIRWAVGIAAGDFLNKNLANWSGLENAGPRPPGAVARILRKCFEMEPGERPSTLAEIVAAFRDEYQQAMRKVYPRLEPTAGSESADSLNNRALSLMDLGKSDDALKLWNQALMIEPGHLMATYNRALILWRCGRLTDLSLLAEISGLKETNGLRQDNWMPHYMLGLIYLELGDFQAALQALKPIREAGILEQEVEDAISLATVVDPTPYKLLYDLKAHVVGMPSAFLTNDGRFLLLIRHPTTVELWDVSAGSCIRTFEDHTYYIASVCLSQDGRYALSGHEDGTVKLWDMGAGNCVRTFVGHSDRVTSVRMSHDGRLLISGSSDGTLRQWDISTGRCISTVTVVDKTYKQSAWRLSQDGRYALSSHGDVGNAFWEIVKLWDISTGSCIRTFEDQSELSATWCLSQDGRYALSAHRDATVKLWDIGTGNCVRTFNGHSGSVTSVCMSNDGQYALSGSHDASFIFWSTTTGQCLKTFATKNCDFVQVRRVPGKAVSYGKEGISVWSIVPDALSFSAPLLISKVASGQKDVSRGDYYEREIREARYILEDGDAVGAAACIRNVRMEPRFDRHPQAVKVWVDLSTRLPTKTLSGAWKLHTIRTHGMRITCIDLSLNGKLLISGSSDGIVKLWDVATGTCVRTFEDRMYDVTSVCISHDGRLAISGGSDFIRLWDISTGSCIRRFDHRTAINTVSLSRDGRFALSGSGIGVDLWETATGRIIRTIYDFDEYDDLQGYYGCFEAHLSQDGRFVLFDGRSFCKFSDISTGRCMAGAEELRVFPRSLSHDGRMAMVHDTRTDTLQLRDMVKGHTEKTLTHSSGWGWVRSVQMSRDSRLALISGRMVELWDVDFEKSIFSIDFKETQYSACLSLDKSCAVLGDSIGTLHIWHLDWELEDRHPENWDDGAKPYLDVFLTQHTPYAGTLPQDREPTDEEVTLALTRKGKPSWAEDDFKDLIYSLGCAGYGWLRPEGVRRKLEEMADEWEGPPPGPEASSPDRFQGLPENSGLVANPVDGSHPDPSEHVDECLTAAEQGVPSAQCILGVQYFRGQGRLRDYQEATRWFRKAAEQGHAKAQYLLGMCYHNGLGVPEDRSEAVEWYRKAADQGVADAQDQLKALHADDEPGNTGILASDEDKAQQYYFSEEEDFQDRKQPQEAPSEDNQVPRISTQTWRVVIKKALKSYITEGKVHIAPNIPGLKFNNARVSHHAFHKDMVAIIDLTRSGTATYSVAFLVKRMSYCRSEEEGSFHYRDFPETEFRIDASDDWKVITPTVEIDLRDSGVPAAQFLELLNYLQSYVQRYRKRMEFLK